MNVLVCAKQVPGTNQVEVDPVTGVLKRDGVSGKLNPYDLYAVEAGLRLAQATQGRVWALSMGPPQAASALREVIAMGAEGGTLVSDRRFGGADVLATAYTLSQAVQAEKGVELVLCGKQTTDGDTAQVGAELAEFLGWPHANNVQEIVPDGKCYVRVRVNLDSCIEVQRIPLPCVLCMDTEVNTPRLPSYLRKKNLSEDCVRVRTLENFTDKDKNHYGLLGSPTQVEQIFAPQKNTEKEMLQGVEEQQAVKLAEILRRRKLI